MKLLKALILICLLGGDHGPDPASLEAFPLAARGCDGRANILCAPAAYPVLLYRGHFSVESALLAGVLLTLIGLLRHSTDLGKPIPTVLIEMASKYKGTRFAFNKCHTAITLLASSSCFTVGSLQLCQHAVLWSETE